LTPIPLEKRAEALELADTIGVREAAAQTGVSMHTIYSWHRRGRTRVPTTPREAIDGAVKEVVQALASGEGDRTEQLEQLIRLLAARDLL
jgi:transposase